jgi:transposase
MTSSTVPFGQHPVVADGLDDYKRTSDKVRREVWQELRKLPEQDAARRFKGARWALLKNPPDLTDTQAASLRKLKRRGGDLRRAYALKEALRAIFAGDLDEGEVSVMLDRFCSKASHSRLKPFVTAAKTIRKRKEGILAAIRLGVNNAGTRDSIDA